MKYYELDEGKNTSSIVVDIQPAYEENTYGESHWTEFTKAAQFLNKQKGPILMFVNAEADSLTDDTVTDIKWWWSRTLKFNNWDNVTINDKGFGYLRGWMDMGVADSTIIKAIRLMYQERVSDSRELFGGSAFDDEEGTPDDYASNMKAALGEWIPNMQYDSIAVEWTSVAQLKQFNGSYIFGGGRDECLKEVTLLMNAFNIKYKVIEDFCYG